MKYSVTVSVGFAVKPVTFPNMGSTVATNPLRPHSFQPTPIYVLINFKVLYNK